MLDKQIHPFRAGDVSPQTAKVVHEIANSGSSTEIGSGFAASQKVSAQLQHK